MKMILEEVMYQGMFRLRQKKQVTALQKKKLKIVVRYISCNEKLIVCSKLIVFLYDQFQSLI